MKKQAFWLPLVGVAALVLVWTAAFAILQNEYLLPSPLSVLQELGKVFSTAAFYGALFSTLLRAVIAFLISLVLAAFFALVSTLSPVFSKIFGGIVVILRSLPTMAVLLLILVGTTRSAAPVAVGVLTLFPLLYTAIIGAIGGVDRELVEMCKVYKVPMKKRLLGLYLPSVLPRVALESVAAFSFSLKLVVSAEVLASTYQSLGGWMQEASLWAQTAKLMAITAAVCAIGLLIELVGGFLIKKWEDALQ